MNIWIVHGVLGLLAWGILAPIGTLISTFRSILFHNHDATTTRPLWDRRNDTIRNDLQDRTWIQLHGYSNELVGLFTWMLFGLATIGVPKGHHYQNLHQIVGLVIFLTTFPLEGLGILILISSKKAQPPAQLPQSSSSSSADETTLLMLPPGDGERVTRAANRSRRTSSQTENVIVGTHRILGISILLAGLWEVYSGILLFSTWTSSNFAWVSVYLYWCCALLVVVVVFLVKMVV